MEYKVRIPVFEGPLDLLLHLLDKAQVDIYNIPIAMITEQYLEYLSSMQQFDMDVASEFLVMAATLLQIKSRMLLPKPVKVVEAEEDYDPEYDPRRELVQRLIEYKQFKHAAEELSKQQRDQAKIFSRTPLSGPWNNQPLPLEGLSLDDLVTAFAAVLQSHAEMPTFIAHEEYTVQDKMQEILRRVRTRAEYGMNFGDLFQLNSSRAEKIVSFLALLELIRLRLVQVRQRDPFGDIVLRITTQQENGNENDVYK
jgi:segregation and condensation protein A